MNAPKVTVRIPSYNHEKYIRDCIDSVLAQTFQDFEIVITDDGSTDSTAEIIKGYNDPRIYLEVLEKNHGSAYAIERCLKRARGEYVANLCSDDAWEPDKLEKQVLFLDSNPQYDAVLTRAQIIDEEGKPFKEQHFYTTAFEVENRSREEWLNRFFYKGNCLCMPSAMIRRTVYEELGFQDKRMASINDFDFWVRFSLKRSFYIMEEQLTRFRVRANNANSSGVTLDHHIRGLFEHKQALNNYLNIEELEFFKSVFGECEKYGKIRPVLIKYFLGRLALDTEDPYKKLWGLETIFNLLKSEKAVEELQQNCDFYYNDLYKLTASADVFGLKLLKVKADYEALCSKALKLEKENEHLSQINISLKRELELSNTEIANMINTLSWRVTKFLRSAKAGYINLKRKLYKNDK